MKVRTKKVKRYVVELDKREALILAQAINTVIWNTCYDETREFLEGLHSELGEDFGNELLGKDVKSFLPQGRE